MDWLIENWIWVAGGVVFLVLIYVFTRPKERKLSKKEQKKMAEMVVGMTNALEELVDDAIGQRYNREDRKKIAVGMMVIIVADHIPLERLKERVILMSIMARSVEGLTKQGEISAR